MRIIKKFNQFFEDIEPKKYLSTLDKKDKKDKNQIDDILSQTEEQKNKIIKKKDTIEKGLLNDIKNFEPENQKDIKVQVNDYKNQIKEFDKTVKQIDKLNTSLKKSIKKNSPDREMQKAKEKNF